MSLLNSSIKDLLLYPLLFVTLLNSYTNFFIIFSPCSNLLNSTTLTVFSSLPPNSFIISAKNFPTISYFNSPTSKSSNIFSFHTFTNLSCIYNKIYWICPSTGSPLIFILIYNLHTIINSDTFSELLLNTCGLTIFALAPILEAASPFCAAKSA